jgi:hypothetical protein
VQGPGGPSRKRAPARLLRARDPAGDRCLAGLGQKRAGPVRVPLGGHVAVKPQRADANEKRPPGLAWEQTYKHRARDALGLADLRHALPALEPEREASTQDFDKPRCREASRPAGPLGPLASRAPSVGAGGKRSKEDGPARGLDKRIRAMALALVRCSAKQSQV